MRTHRRVPDRKHEALPIPRRLPTAPAPVLDSASKARRRGRS